MLVEFSVMTRFLGIRDSFRLGVFQQLLPIRGQCAQFHSFLGVQVLGMADPL